MTAAALGELEAGEPQLIAAFERAKQSEADRRQAAMPVIRPKHVAGNGDGLDSSGTGVLFDEVAGDERALELVEKIGGFVGFSGQAAIEALVGGAFANQRAQQCQDSDVSGLKHAFPGDGSRLISIACG